ncbi:P-granule-associated novel protein 1-like [Anopheles nili]|uniref:P-granule-associated novel protein 1-like n=1 Tax=Anopheles nili TaxID=185578 RepID=UPI00237A2BFE|nr:P-granule-associated novel protein 1-like [Anopheles nili]
MVHQTKTHVAVVLLSTVLFSLHSFAEITHECTIKKGADENMCVFRNIVYGATTPDVTFKAPSSKVHSVAFENSSLEHIPEQFLAVFPNLRALYVPDVNLTSVVIPMKLERLNAANNRITNVIVHQTRETTTMLELMLDSNNLHDVSNLTQLVKLEILNLSGNKDLPKDDTVDLERFRGLDNLRHLLLADMSMLYIENEKQVAFPELELLELSSNNLLTDSLNVQVFAPMKALQILRLAYNQLTNLDVMQLTANNPQLKQIYLEGNNFACNHQLKMLEFLKEAGIDTPVTNSNPRCMVGFELRNHMCCKWTIPDASEVSTVEVTVTTHVDELTTSTVTPVTSGPKSNIDKNHASSVTLANVGSMLVCLSLVAMAKLVSF